MGEGTSALRRGLMAWINKREERTLCAPLFYLDCNEESVDRKGRRVCLCVQELERNKEGSVGKSS